MQPERAFLYSGLVTLLLCACSCSRRATGSAPSISRAESISFEYAVYLLPGHNSPEPEALLTSISSKRPVFKLVSHLPDKPETTVLHAYLKSGVTKSYAPPPLKALSQFSYGLTGQQKEDLEKSSTALILDFAYPRSNVWSGLQAAGELAEDLARRSGGLVWDEETREVFSPDAWHDRRLASWSEDVPDVPSQTVIHIYSNGEFARAITLGMSKMGLPDVVVQETPWSSANQVGNLINIFSQSMAERPAPHASDKYRLDLRAIRNSHLREHQLEGIKGNGAGVACLTLREGKWEEGDPKNRLVRIDGDQYPGADAHAKQDSMISSFFGWNDALTKVKHNQKLMAESAKAKSKLPELRRVFNAGLAPGEYIEVKAPFKAENGDTEWMWVEVTHWNDDQIRGTLENEPVEVTSLRAGEVVEVREQDIFDYIHQFADKHLEGNTTGEIIRKMSEGTGQDSAPAIPVPACDSE